MRIFFFCLFLFLVRFYYFDLVFVNMKRERTRPDGSRLIGQFYMDQLRNNAKTVLGNP